MTPEQVASQADFIAFLEELRGSLETSPQAWENRTLPDFLEGLEAWVRDSSEYFKRHGEPPPQGEWRLVARALAAAAIYE